MKRTYGLTIGLGLVLIMSACGENDANDQADTNNNNLDPAENETNNDENANETNENEVNNDDESSENNQTNNNQNNNDADNEENNDMNENETNEQNNNESADEAAMIDDVSLFFIDNQALNLYKVPTGESVEMSEDGAAETFNMWLEGPESDGLSPIAHEDTELDYVEFHDDTAHVSFTETILESNVGASSESMLVDQIALMIEQFDIDETLILIEGEDAGDFLGHMNLSEPVEAGNPDDYDVFEE